MWRRLRRRTLAPSRPAVFARQIPLLVFSLTALMSGLAILFVLID
jgi:hypothetical protein